MMIDLGNFVNFNKVRMNRNLCSEHLYSVIVNSVCYPVRPNVLVVTWQTFRRFGILIGHDDA